MPMRCVLRPHPPAHLDFERHGGLVRFDLAEHVPGHARVPRLLGPLGNGPVRHGRRERGHRDGRHLLVCVVGWGGVGASVWGNRSESTDSEGVQRNVADAHARLAHYPKRSTVPRPHPPLKRTGAEASPRRCTNPKLSGSRQRPPQQRPSNGSLPAAAPRASINPRARAPCDCRVAAAAADAVPLLVASRRRDSCCCADEAVVEGADAGRRLPAVAASRRSIVPKRPTDACLALRI